MLILQIHTYILHILPTLQQWVVWQLCNGNWKVTRYCNYVTIIFQVTKTLWKLLFISNFLNITRATIPTSKIQQIYLYFISFIYIIYILTRIKVFFFINYSVTVLDIIIHIYTQTVAWSMQPMYCSGRDVLFNTRWIDPPWFSPPQFSLSVIIIIITITLSICFNQIHYTYNHVQFWNQYSIQN